MTDLLDTLFPAQKGQFGPKFYNKFLITIIFLFIICVFNVFSA